MPVGRGFMEDLKFGAEGFDQKAVESEVPSKMELAEMEHGASQFLIGKSSTRDDFFADFVNCTWMLGLQPGSHGYKPFFR